MPHIAKEYPCLWLNSSSISSHVKADVPTIRFGADAPYSSHVLRTLRNWHSVLSSDDLGGSRLANYEPQPSPGEFRDYESEPQNGSF